MCGMGAWMESLCVDGWVDESLCVGMGAWMNHVCVGMGVWMNHCVLVWVCG